MNFNFVCRRFSFEVPIFCITVRTVLLYELWNKGKTGTILRHNLLMCVWASGKIFGLLVFIISRINIIIYI